MLKTRITEVRNSTVLELRSSNMLLFISFNLKLSGRRAFVANQAHNNTAKLSIKRFLRNNMPKIPKMSSVNTIWLKYKMKVDKQESTGLVIRKTLLTNRNAVRITAKFNNKKIIIF
ncbi:MAG: hypothetical protein V2A64_04500 [Candidatus Omnitrophota bacterium]